MSGPGYRPATAKVRAAVFSMLESRGCDFPGLRVLDLYAGSGSLGLEALSRGAGYALFVEKDPRAAAAVRQTLNDFMIDISTAQVVCRDVAVWLRKKAVLPFDLVCIDPPYGHDLLVSTLGQVLDQSWLQDGGILLAEVESSLVVPNLEARECDLLVDRVYGQTRILLWKKRETK